MLFLSGRYVDGDAQDKEGMDYEKEFTMPAARTDDYFVMPANRSDGGSYESLQTRHYQGSRVQESRNA